MLRHYLNILMQYFISLLSPEMRPAGGCDGSDVIVASMAVSPYRGSCSAVIITAEQLFDITMMDIKHY